VIGRRFALAAYWLALVLWLSALVSAAVAAMNVFPALDALRPTAAKYAAVEAGAHARLVAGDVMEGVFTTVDLLQFAAVPLAVLALAAQILALGFPWRTPANVIRIACTLVAAACFAFYALALAPAMNRSLREAHAAAERGDVPAMRAARAAFDERHPRATAIHQIDLALVVVAIVASAAAFAPPAPHPRDPGGLGR
jgi:hypothetical protein